MKAKSQTGNALAAAAETTKPTLYEIYMATCSKSKHHSTAGQWASFYRRAYLGCPSYHTNQHSPPPWPGDDVCKQSNGQSLGSVFEHLKPVDESEVLVVPMKVYDLVLGLPWLMVRNPEINCSNIRLTALRAPSGLQRAKIPEADWTSPLRERGEVTKMVSLLRVYNYSGLPQSMISELVKKWSRHSSYDLANVKGCWEHRWKASPNVRETPGCWMREQEQRR